MTNRDHLEIAYSSINVFADDGQLDLNELNFLLGIALRDNDITDDEKRVLNSVFTKATPLAKDQKVLDRIAEVRKQYGI